jgi:ATP-binding cassette subfamily B protein
MLGSMSMGMGSPRMGGGRGMIPEVGLVRRGQEREQGRRLPKGLIGRVWREFARPYRGRLGLLVLTIVAASALDVLPARLVGYITDTFTPPAAPDAGHRLTLLALAFAGVALGSAGLSLAQRYQSSWVGERLIYDLRRRLFHHIQRMPIAFFTRTQTGAVVSRMNNDVIGAQRALTGTFGTLASNSVQVLVAVGFMAAISWQLTLLVLAVLPLFVWLAKRVGRRLQELTRESMQYNADMNTLMNERFNVAGALVVKLFGDPVRETDDFAARAEGVADTGVRSAVVGRLFFAILALVGSLGVAVAYWVGGQGVLRGTFSVGDVVAFGALVTRAYQPLAALTNAPVEVMTALVSFDRVFEVLDVDNPITDAPGAVALEEPRGEVVFDAVSFAYPAPADSSLASLERGWAEVLDAEPGPEVLHDVSFVAEPGQTVALVGPSGSGKSTICNLVPRLYDVSAGAVWLDGHDVRQLTLDSIKDAVGMVTQDPHLLHDTVRANLRYANRTASDAELEAACRAAAIHDVITALPEGYDTLVGERGYRLSGGEKQRMAIARMLLKDPAVVVLDEATSHLDSESEEVVQQALGTALAGRTSLVIAHRLSTVANADQILVIDDGRIVQRGTHAELVATPGLYAELYRTQLAPA